MFLVSLAVASLASPFAVADLPDGHGGRTSPQAAATAEMNVMQFAAREGCCSEAVTAQCQQQITAAARVPAQAPCPPPETTGPQAALTCCDKAVVEHCQMHHPR
jgi:hypothetical protein